MAESTWSVGLEGLRKDLEQQALRSVRDEGEAAELAQEVIFRCISRSPDDSEPLLPYARTVMANLLRRRWRAGGWTVPIEDLEEGGKDEHARERGNELAVLEREFERIAARDFLALLRRRTRLLPKDLRLVCEQRWFGGLGYREIAAALGIDETTARVRCHKARRLLECDPVVRQVLGSARSRGPSGSKPPFKAADLAAGEAPATRRSG